MAFRIHASIRDGQPCLRIIDADTGKTCLNWHCERRLDCDIAAQQQMHDLFRRLLLISTQQQLATDENFTRAAQCAPAPDPVSGQR